ncbi:unnamed protein product [Durusdinium trenchii]|uniref:Calpain catalytic domain-containing protein n=1 Tax=Durusdinium trenchii TaxID=1381693 RepID=A0ABP0JAX4_9DINO
MESAEQLLSKAAGAVRGIVNAAEGGFQLLAQVVEEAIDSPGYPAQTPPSPASLDLRTVPPKPNEPNIPVKRIEPNDRLKSIEPNQMPTPDCESLVIRALPRPSDAQLSEGDKVHVWSKSRGTWTEDGEVVEISKVDVQILGETITKGSVYVLFDEGSKAKWVRPSDINVLLKKPGWSPQAGSATPPGYAGYNLPQDCDHNPGDRLSELRALQSAHGGKQFHDESFPPKLRGRVTRWCRPSEIGAHDGRVLWRSEDWQLLRGQPRADDVQQGELGDCWFLSSLAAMAEFQEGRLVQRLLPEQKSLSPAGVYLVRLWLGGSWRDIIVDDRLPCIGNGLSTYYQLAYCSTRRCQLWASIIEKGFAKACGSYEAIAGGQPEEALSILTGWPCETIQFDSEDFDPGILWATMSTSREAKFLMTVSTSCGRSHSEQDVRAAGLVPNHAYSLIDVLDIEDASGCRMQLLKIRNPHGEAKWRGNWSERSQLWTPELRQRVGCAKAIEDHMFFMSYNDFLNWFECCTICKVHSDGWHKVRMPTPLPGNGIAPTQGWRLTVAEMTECCLTLAQPQDRARSGPVFLPLNLGKIAGAGFVLVCVDEAQQKSLTTVTVGHPRCRAIVSADCWLKPGLSYFLLPLSLLDGPEIPAVFSCFSRKTVQIQEHSFSDSAVVAGWAAFIKSSAKEPDNFHGARVYIAKSHGGMVACMAENHGRGFFQVELAFQQLENQLSFSRGTGNTTDWLAPGEAQILQVVIPAGSGGWRSSQRYQMQFTRPHQALHSPDLAFACSELHRPFEMARVQKPQKGKGVAKWFPF